MKRTKKMNQMEEIPADRRMKKRAPFKLDRRNFLRGVGTTGLVLPFLESMPERSAFAQSSNPVFGLFICTANGVVGNRFWPGQTGPLTTAGMSGDTSKATSILADYADKLLIINGMRYAGGGGIGCSHADALARCLTAGGTQGSNNNIVANGISADTAIANGLGVTPLTLYSGMKEGYIDEKLSFSGPGQVRAAEGNPYNVYLDLAGLLDQGTGNPTPMADYLAERRKSVNDLVRADVNSLMNSPQISAADRQRLQLHLDSIRDMENNMNDMMEEGTLSCTGANLDMAALESFQGGNAARQNGVMEDVVKLQLELAAIAFACNVTQVATLQAGDGTDGTQYTVNGEKYERFHHISHRINSDGSSGSPIAGAEDKHHQIDRIRMETFRLGIEKWAQYETPNGPLLDNGFMYWTSHVSDGPSHSFNNLPVIIAGSAGGYLKQGEYINVNGNTNSPLLNTLINACGVQSNGFGDGNGQIDAMLA